MATNYGKLDYSITLNPTSAFPLDGRTYFESLSEAQSAARSAVEAGSSEGQYYYGLILTVNEGGSSKMYVIQPDKSLKPIVDNSDLSTEMNKKANVDQQMYIGTTMVPINRGSGALTLNGVNISGSSTYVDRDRGSNTVSTLTNLPVNKSLVIANLSSATNISVQSGLQVGESITVIGNISGSFSQPIPTSGSFVSMDGSSISVGSGDRLEINILCYESGKYSISCKLSL